MKKFIFTAIATLFLAASSFAQTSTAPSSPSLSDLGFSTFSLDAGAMTIHGGGQTIPVSSLSQNIALTSKLSFGVNELLGGQASSSASSSTTPSTPGMFQAYLGRVKYFLPTPTKLSNTALGPINFYVTGGTGVNRFNNAAANTVNKLAFEVGGGVNINPKSLGNMSFNVGEVDWMRLPGFANSAVAVRTAIKLSF